MSEIQIFADAHFFKWVVTGLIGLVVALLGFLWRNLKNDFDKFKRETISKYKELRDQQKEDHDLLHELFTEHKNNHSSKIVP